MTDWSNTDNARAALADPNLPAGELAAITAAQPSLWPQVAAHPAAYPDLLGWLAAQGVPVPPRAQPPVSQQTPAPAMPAATAQTAPAMAQQNLPPGTPPARPRKHRRGLVIAIVAAAVVVVVGVAAIVWATNQPS
ncbi:MAG: hypothetical protein FWF28_06830, partial [Micrococcales bacterium]|nr:hypothetical protein [Micrococcales bacterium]